MPLQIVCKHTRHHHARRLERGVEPGVHALTFQHGRAHRRERAAEGRRPGHSRGIVQIKPAKPQ